MTPPGKLRREEIIDAAGEVADTLGVAALNVTRLAESLRIKTRALHRHFANLEMIKDALAASTLSELIDLHKDATRDRTGRAAFYALAHGHRTYAQARPGRYAAAINGAQSRSASVAALRRSLLRLVASMLEAYRLEGDHAMEVARGLIAALQGFIVVELGGGGGSPFEADQAYQTMLEMLDAGVRDAARGEPNRRRDQFSSVAAQLRPEIRRQAIGDAAIAARASERVSPERQEGGR